MFCMGSVSGGYYRAAEKCLREATFLRFGSDDHISVLYMLVKMAVRS